MPRRSRGGIGPLTDTLSRSARPCCQAVSETPRARSAFEVSSDFMSDARAPSSLASTASSHRDHRGRLSGLDATAKRKLVKDTRFKALRALPAWKAFVR